MSDEIPPWLAERDAKSRNKRNLPKGCRSLISLFIFMVLLIAVLLYGVNLHVGDLKQSYAHQVCQRIGYAVEQFYKDYRSLPLPGGPPPQGGDRDTDTSSAHGFVAMLLGHEADSGTRQNTNRTNYLEMVQFAKRTSTDKSSWEDGIFREADTGAYGIIDSFGHPYRVRLDTNSDQHLANPNTEEAAKGRPTLSKQVIVWGAGKDGDWDTWKDNPKSWD